MVAEVVEDGITDVLSAESLSKTTVNLISNLTYFHYLTRNSAKTSYGLTEFTNTLRRVRLLQLILIIDTPYAWFWWRVISNTFSDSIRH